MTLMKSFVTALVGPLPNKSAATRAPPIVVSDAELVAGINALHKHCSYEVAKLESHLDDKAKARLRALLQLPLPLLVDGDLSASKART